MPGGKRAVLLGLALSLGLGVSLLVLLDPGGGAPVPVPSPTDPSLEEPIEPDAPAPIEKPAPDPSGPDRPDRATSQENRPSFGTIVGELQIEAEESLPAVEKFWVYLQEARNPVTGSPKTYTREFSYSDQGGRFQLPQVPLGAWRVSVVVPEMVGSEAIRVLTPEEPLARVVLTVRTGRDLPIFVHDPDRRPMDGVDVLLHPKGEPPGRRALAGKTDGLGAVTLRNVLHGAYEIHVGPQWQLLAQPKEIQVGPVEPRFVRYEIPLGGDMKVTVLSEGGYPVAGAECHLISLQTPRFREFRATTDKLGLASFGKVAQGQYQLRVRAEGFRVEIKPGVEVVENQENRQEIYLKMSRGE